MNAIVYKCLVVDDEPLARDILRRYIEKTPSLILIAECANALDAVPLLRNHHIDILFIDIRMPQLSGMDLVRSLTTSPKIIFTTAYEEYAFQSYELNAVDYLLKPIRFERFIKSVNKAIASISGLVNDDVRKSLGKDSLQSDGFLYFRSERKMVKVHLKDILYIESLKDYVKIVLYDQKVITKYSMIAIETMLSSADFLRTHRSFIVAIKKLTSYTANHVQIGAIELPIGKVYQREVLKKLEEPKM